MSKRYAFKSFFYPALIYSLSGMVIFYFFWPSAVLLKNGTVITLGIIGIWRYAFLLIQYIRAFIYRFYVYEKMKLKVFSKPLSKQYPERIYFSIPSYREEPWVSVEVFQSIFTELQNIPSSATIIVSVADAEDEKIISSIYNAHPFNEKVELVIQYQNEGKRIAMGNMLRAIARRVNERGDEKSITIFMDADSCLTKGALVESVPMLYTQKNVGAVTTDEVAYIHTKSSWYKDWFNLKFGQRHILFQSQSLSKKVLTLTGRFSLFKTEVVIREDFISMLENDILSDANFGKFRFLMGDDKTTWYYLLKEGYDMLYLPDVSIYSLESRDGNFLEISRTLPFRWYGNTLRNNERARKLKNLPPFIRYLLWDQIFLMWTALIGLVGILFLTLFVNFIYLPIYVAWVLLVRVFKMFVIVLGNHPVTWRTLPLMLYSQWVGAVIKINAYYHLYDQTYSKNKTIQNADASITFVSKRVPLFSKFRMGVALSLFIVFMLLSYEKIFEAPSIALMNTPLSTEKKYLFSEVNVQKLNDLIQNAQDNSTIVLQLKKLELTQPIVIQRSNITIDFNHVKLISHLRSPNKAAIIVAGVKEKKHCAILQTNLKDAKVITLSKSVANKSILLIEEPNDRAFVQGYLGATPWYKKYPTLRSEIVKVVAVQNKKAYLQYLSKSPIDAGAKVFKLHTIAHIHLKNIDLEGDTHAVPNLYKNSRKDLFVDGIYLHYVSDATLKNITLKDIGSNPLVFERTYNVEGENINIDGAVNKGKKGHGYLRFNKAFHSYLHNVKVQNIRHITFQWSSAYNVIDGLYSEVDVNFHGGASHDNLVTNATFNVPLTHKWGEVYTTPKNAHWAPPDLQNNRVE